MPVKISFLLLALVISMASASVSSRENMDELCNNALDDDGDGLIDLNDPDCLCQAQEPPSLIPNPSFEEYNCCPSGNQQLNCAQTWIQASEATTDYFHRCGYFFRDEFPVPMPLPDGDAYIGFRNGRFTRNPNPNWKEYTGACLLSPLEAGTRYTFQFNIGFVSSSISPPMNVVLYGTTDCKNLPFGVGNSTFGCPTNGPGWQVLGQVYVRGANTWNQYEITTTPKENITAIAMGPDCLELNLTVNPYYFLDNLILADSELFGPTIETAGHPCDPDFGLIASAKENATYQWYRDGVAVVGATEREINIGDQEGDYQVMATTEANCVVSDPYDYTIPTFDTRSQIIVCPGDAYRFGDRSFNRSGSYTHTFQSYEGCDSTVQLDLTVLTEQVDSVEHYFFKGEVFQMGRYSFNAPTAADLTFTSSLGCDSLVHLTLKQYQLYIPNAFSPNEDGINDHFAVYGSEELLEIRSMKIFDRWGNRVYEQTGGESYRWDGGRAGRVLETGVYIYMLELILNDGTRKILSGDVAIVR